MNSETATSNQILEYQQKIESLLYTTVITKPDIAKTANKLSEFLINLFRIYLDSVNRAISFLFETRFLAIEYNRLKLRYKEIFICASDTAFENNRINRKSIEDYLCKLYNNSIDWKASKQKTVTISITEAELLTITEAGKQFF